MRLATFLAPGDDRPRAGEVRGDEVIEFADGSTVADRLASGDRAPAGGTARALAGVELLAPIPEPRVLFGVGMNYRAHAAEMGNPVRSFPVIWTMSPSASAPPFAPVVCPPVVRQLDYEGELVFVLGRDGEVAGYAVGDDLTARDIQDREPQWTRAKGADGTSPWGPWITTADELGDPHDLRLRTWVNGEIRQDARTSDLVFTVPEIVAFLRETNTLRPGDVVFTGTPVGVGYARDPQVFLGPGDVVRIEIEGLGAIEHPMASAVA